MAESDDKSRASSPPLLDAADRWIWGVWIIVALVAVAILPFASRLGEVASVIASFCAAPFG